MERLRKAGRDSESATDADEDSVAELTKELESLKSELCTDA